MDVEAVIPQPEAGEGREEQQGGEDREESMDEEAVQKDDEMEVTSQPLPPPQPDGTHHTFHLDPQVVYVCSMESVILSGVEMAVLRVRGNPSEILNTLSCVKYDFVTLNDEEEGSTVDILCSGPAHMFPHIQAGVEVSLQCVSCHAVKEVGCEEWKWELQLAPQSTETGIIDRTMRGQEEHEELPLSPSLPPSPPPLIKTVLSGEFEKKSLKWVKYRQPHTAMW